MLEAFKKDVDTGLSMMPKSLPSKYFYDKTGDALFVKIMGLPEYYLTRCELDIFKNKTQMLVDALKIRANAHFELIELGAGDGLKTKELLRFLDDRNFSFDYMPVDISSNALQLLAKNIKQELPNVKVEPQQGDYFDVLASLNQRKTPKVVLFLGSNIGNMHDALAAQFLGHLAENMQPKDKLLLGLDLIKPKEIVLPAYNDNQGVTAEFNLNLLRRINQELGADFNLSQFKHQAKYNEEEGIAKSFISSLAAQKVQIKALNKTYEFAKGEKIQTEISRKYNDTIVQSIIAHTDLHLLQKITDSKHYFADYILNKT